MISTLQAHIALDKLREVHDRLRAIVVDAQEGRYCRDAFWESVSPIIWELYMCDPERTLAEVAQQLPE